MERLILGVKDIKDFEDIVLYPNPTTGELHVTFPSFGGAGVVCHSSLVTNIEIFDVYGRNILHSIDVSGLHAGIYFVKITTEKGIVMKKIIKL